MFCLMWKNRKKEDWYIFVKYKYKNKKQLKYHQICIHSSARRNLNLYYAEHWTLKAVSEYGIVVRIE